MAGFKTHITASTLLGIGYGAAGLTYDVPVATAILAGGLCGVSGMLPDLDSDSGVPLRETIAFGAAITPMLLIDRLRELSLSNEAIVLAGVCVYFFIRFLVAEIFKRYTVHRGMWHSIPAAFTISLLVLWITSGDTFQIRFYKAFAVLLGFLSHLALDELYSIEFKSGRLRFKKSFGTAMKFFGPRWWGNISVYGKLAIMIAVVVNDPVLRDQYGNGSELLPPRMAERLEDEQAIKTTSSSPAAPSLDRR